MTVNDKGSEVASTFAWLSLSLKLDNMTQKNSFSLLPSYWLLPLDDLYAFILTKAPINDVRTVSKSISLRQLSSEIQKFSLLLVQGFDKLQSHSSCSQLTNTYILLLTNFLIREIYSETFLRVIQRSNQLRGVSKIIQRKIMYRLSRWFIEKVETRVKNTWYAIK